MKTTAIALCLALVACPAIAPASEPCLEAVAVDLPCRGLLIPEQDARECWKCLEVDLPQCWLGVERLDEQHQITLEALQEDLETERQARAHADMMATDLAAQLKPPAWWESPILWGGVGLLVGLAAGIAIFVAVDDD